MNKEELKKRTKHFSLRIIKLVNALPKTQTGKIVGGQLLRSGTSTAANYRSACRSRSTAEFIAKLGVVIEEADESIFWMEIIIESGLMKKKLVQDLIKEGNEILSIMIASSKSASKRK